MSLTRFFERVLSSPTSDLAPSRDSSTFVRETFYDYRTPLPELIAALYDNRLTGRLIFDLKDGRVNAIRVREEVTFDIT